MSLFQPSQPRPSLVADLAINILNRQHKSLMALLWREFKDLGSIFMRFVIRVDVLGRTPRSASLPRDIDGRIARDISLSALLRVPAAVGGAKSKVLPKSHGKLPG